MRAWLHECTTAHETCERDASVFSVKLPRRLLCVRNDDEGDSVRLVETEGKHGAYCALSHCWGPVDKQPIRTLRSNIQDHYCDISFGSLPQTFRDAVVLTRALDIDYLWIDSLCIVQDDEEDWRREAVMMGSLYQSAALVIVAAGSEDPGGGLFMCERPEGDVLQFPRARLGGKFSAVFGSTIRGSDICPEMVPTRGPLRQRAWAFQEWALSRRKVFFMPGGLTWDCKSLQLEENGACIDLILHENMSWFTLLEMYSDKVLKYPSDRLIALEGLVKEEEKARNDRFLDEGVWENDIPRHLSWFQVTPSTPDQDNPAFPSWSWACTGGRKSWISEFHHQEQDCMTVHGVSHAGSLRMSGASTILNVERAIIRYCCHRAVRQLIIMTLSSAHAPEFGMIADGLSSCVVRSGGEVVGILALDQGFVNTRTLSVAKPFLFWYAGKTHREEEDPW